MNISKYKDSSFKINKIKKQLTIQETDELFKEYIKYKNELTIAEDKEKIHQKIIEIRNKIVLGNMELVYNIIKKRILYIYENEEEEDIYQIAYEILIKFVDIYDTNQNNTFSNFLYHYLIGRVDDALEKTKAIYLPVHIKEKIKTVIKTKESLEQYHKKEVSIKVLAEKLNWSEKKVCNILSIIDFLNVESYDELIEKENFILNNEELIQYQKHIVDENAIEKEFITKELINTIKKIIEKLTEREQEIIKLHYGFYDDIKYTFDEIGEKLSITGARVHQIESRALTKIRNHKKMLYYINNKNT